MRRAPRFGVAATASELAAPELRQHKRSVVHAMRAMNLEQFRASGIELVIGAARSVGPRRVEVATAGVVRLLEGDQAVIDLGTRPVIPDIPDWPAPIRSQARRCSSSDHGRRPQPAVRKLCRLTGARAPGRSAHRMDRTANGGRPRSPRPGSLTE